MNKLYRLIPVFLILMAVNRAYAQPDTTIGSAVGGEQLTTTLDSLAEKERNQAIYRMT